MAPKMNQSHVVLSTLEFLVLSLNNPLLSGSLAVMTMTTITTDSCKELISRMAEKLAMEATDQTDSQEVLESLM